MLSKFLFNKKTFFIAVFVFILFLIGLQLIKIHQTQAVFCLPGEVEVAEDCDGNEIVPAKCCPSDQPKYSDNHCVAECPGGNTCPSGEVEVIQNCDGDKLTPSRCCPEDLPFYNDGTCVSICPNYEWGDNNAVVPICAGTPPHYDNQCDDN